MEQWAEIRRLHFAEGMGIKAVARELGLARNTVREAVRSTAPPRYERASAGSAVDAVEAEIRALLARTPTMPATVIAERIAWRRGMTVLCDRVAALRPLYVEPEGTGRTVYEPGELAQWGLVEQWLKAGVIHDGRFAATEEGAPQGGVVSPLLLNIALHGMEQAAGVRYRKLGTHAAMTAMDSPVLVRYADDLVALCHSREQALEVKAVLVEWLAPRGLTVNEDKTQVVSAEDGFDFLGFNVRRYDNKLLIKPSTAAVRRIRQRLRAEMTALRGANASAVLSTINPIVRGWTAYYRTVVSSATFTALDSYMWRLTYRWAVRGHRNKPTRWVVARYFGRFNTARSDRWVFGDRDSGAYLHKFSWTTIVRHQMVKGTSSPDDPALTGYWAERRHKGPPLPLSRTDLRRLKAQDSRCPVCGGLLLDADQEPQSPREWEHWLLVVRKATTKQHVVARGTHGRPHDDVRLIHGHCHRRPVNDDDSQPALLPARTPSGLA